MIYKNAQYGNVEGVTIVEFGNGTLSVVSGSNKDYESVLIKKCPKKPIGEIGVKVNNSDDYLPDVAIVFKNEESFNVFFEIVLEVKSSFESKKDKS